MYLTPLRKRNKINYMEDESMNIQSTSRWKKEMTHLLKIKVEDQDIESMFWKGITLERQSRELYIPEWETGKWLLDIDIKTLDVSDKVKTLIGKIKYVYLTQSRMKEMYVDGFMDSMLHLLCFDDYPCFMYPQYEYSTSIGEDNNQIIAISDFGIISEGHKMLIVVEDKTMKNASYANNWKEDQVMGELFVAVHNTVENNPSTTYPLHIYAIRVVGTLFTFYKAIASLDYIKESSRGYPVKTSMAVERHPEVLDDPSQLTAYDFCILEQRKQILLCMSAIKEIVST